MDTTYAKLGLPFKQALSVLATVISVSPAGYVVADCGLKALVACTSELGRIHVRLGHVHHKLSHCPLRGGTD
jgi:D-serine deaminase-like pyridoxal phosphate-dependent protein